MGLQAEEGVVAVDGGAFEVGEGGQQLVVESPPLALRAAVVAAAVGTRGPRAVQAHDALFFGELLAIVGIALVALAGPERAERDETGDDKG